MVRLLTFRDVLAPFCTHAEVKNGDAVGRACA
jgi:hypothetical protein